MAAGRSLAKVLLVMCATCIGAGLMAVGSYGSRLLQTRSSGQSIGLELDAPLRQRLCPAPDHLWQSQCQQLQQLEHGLDAAGQARLSAQLQAHPDRCAAMLGMPQVALLFLTRGPMPHEAMWTEWLHSAAGLVLVDCIAERACHASSSSSPGDGKVAAAGALPAAAKERRVFPGGDGLVLGRACHPSPKADAGARQHLFTLYMHTTPDFEGYPEGSIFHGHEIADRVEVKWGEPTGTEAARNLLKAALTSPLNQRFLMVSESCVPLYPPAMLYTQLIGAVRSRVNACPAPDLRYEPDKMQPAMAGDGLTMDLWRKSSQFFLLTRAHAEVVVEDEFIWGKFRDHCRMGVGTDGQMHICLTDEHYIPTLLAYRQLDNETDCPGIVTGDVWEWDRSKDDWPPAHPKEYTPEEVTPEQLHQIRASTSAGFEVPAVSSAQVHKHTRRHGKAGLSDGDCGQYVAALQHPPPLAAIEDALLGSCAWRSLPSPLLGRGCPLLARKFKAETAEAMLALSRLEQAHLTDRPSPPGANPAWHCPAL